MNATVTSKHIGDNGSKSKVHAMPTDSIDGKIAVCGRKVEWINAGLYGTDHEITCLSCVKIMRKAEAAANTDKLIAESDARIQAVEIDADHGHALAMEAAWNSGNIVPASAIIPVVEITGDVDVPSSLTTADVPAESDDVPFEDRHAAYVASLKSDPEVMAMYTSEAAHTAAQTPSGTGCTGVMQNVPGFNATEHIHAADCRDIKREMSKFGQSEGDTFPYPSGMTVWDIIETNASDLSSDNYTVGTLEHAQDMIYQASGMLRFMPCAASLPLGVTPFGPLIDAEGQYMISEDRTDTRAYVESLGLSESRVEGLDAESAFVDMLSPNGEPWGEMRNLRYYGNGEMFPAMLSMISRDWDSFTLYDMGCYVVVGIIDPCKRGSIMSVLVWSVRCENTPCEYAAPRVVESEPEILADATPSTIMSNADVLAYDEWSKGGERPLTAYERKANENAVREAFHCPNCLNTYTDEFPYSDQHMASCLICGSDGHAECQHEHEISTNFGPDCIMSELANIAAPSVMEALLSVDAGGVTVSLGWQTITVPVGTEKSLATLYAEQSGSTWHRGGIPDWDSIITVTDTYTR